MILLRHLQLNNFLSHENTSIDFSPDEKSLIDGASGAGKSSIFDGIIWALYGQGRSDNKSMVRKSATKCSVVLTLCREDEHIIITRTATTGGKHTLEIAVQRPDGSKEALPLSGVRETQAWIDRDLVGASHLLFINSVAYVQGNSESFVSQTAPKRKELLLEIIKAEDYSKYYENARQALARLNNDESRINGQIIELEANLGLLRASLKDKNDLTRLLDESLTALAETHPKIENLEKQRLALSVIDDKLKRIVTAIANTVFDGDELTKSIEQKKAKLSGKIFNTEELDKRTSELTRQMQEGEIEIRRRNELAERRPLVRDRSKQIEEYKKELENIKKQPVCPSGSSCPYSGDHWRGIARFEMKIFECENDTQREKDELSLWEKEWAVLPPKFDPAAVIREMAAVSEERRLADTEAEIRAELPFLEERISIKKAQVESLKSEKHELEKQIDPFALAKINEMLLSLKTYQGRISTDIAEIRAAISAAEKTETEIKKTEERILQFKKTDLVDIQNKAKKIALVKDAFGSKGIETLVIDYLLPRLEDRINDVLSKLSDFRVRLDTQRKSSDGESLVEGLFITILNEMNEEMPFEAYSGGEKLKISVSISEALATLQKVGFRLFDETITALDENSLESFTEIMGELLGNFKQTLMISHIQEIKDLFEVKINVKKRGGITVAT